MTGFEPQISGYEAPILPTVPQPLPKAKQLFIVQSQQYVRPQICLWSLLIYQLVNALFVKKSVRYLPICKEVSFYL